ncbi:hypothetical protein RsoM2USA_310 [Ralstonia phage RsoM2USA]|nr:hypothetical protein RsoM2USA_310 [Ralstonia phage RsoM2USA]
MKLNEITDIYNWARTYSKNGSTNLHLENGKVLFMAMYLNAPTYDNTFVPPPIECQVETNCRILFFDVSTITLDWLDSYQNLTIDGDGDFTNLLPEIRKSVQKVNPNTIVINTLLTSTLNIPELCSLPCNVSVAIFRKVVNSSYENSEFILYTNKGSIEIIEDVGTSNARVIKNLDQFTLQDWLIDNGYENFI